MLSLLLGCSYVVNLDETGLSRGEYAEMSVSEHEVDFGVVPTGDVVTHTVTVSNTGGATLGVGAYTGGEGLCATWLSMGEDCGGVSVPADASDSTDEKPCANGLAAATDRLALPPGCFAEAGIVLQAPAPRTLLGYLAFVAQPLGDEHDRQIAWADDRKTVQAVKVLAGEPDPTTPPRLAWTDTVLPFSWHWPDESSVTATTSLTNLGDTDVEFSAIDASGCPAAKVESAPEPGLLAPGEIVPVMLSWTATERASTRCTLVATSVDGGDASLVLTTKMPVHSDPPSIVVNQPLPGDLMVAGEPVTVALTLGDDLAPPSTVTFSVQVGDGGLVPGLPPDELGVASAALPGEFLVDGATVLTVRATDFQGEVREVSVPVRVGTRPPDDADADGWALADGDCDDLSVATYPHAIEAEDGVDNNCDGTVDEGTLRFDDDGDGYSEADGDCDDTDPQVYPAAAESYDGFDEDCDGIVDNGQSQTDDDLDGYDEGQYDCDDDDPAINPAALELCDGVDNDCDGVRDEDDGCVGPWLGLADPYSATFLDVSPDGCLPGETVTAELWTTATDATFSWGTSAWSIHPGEDFTATTTCIAPMGAAETVDLWVVASDEMSRHRDTAGAFVAHEEPHWGSYTTGDTIVPATPCAPFGAGAAFLPLGAGFTLAVRRRRR